MDMIHDAVQTLRLQVREFFDNEFSSVQQRSSSITGHKKQRNDFHLPPTKKTPSGQKPSAHLYILILQRLHIEPDCRNRLNSLVTLILQPIQNGGLSGIVKTKNENSHFFGAKEALEHSAHYYAHLDGIINR